MRDEKITLTDNRYWDNNWKEQARGSKVFEKLMFRINPSSVSFRRILSKYIKPGNKILEIGAAPGLWLASINKQLCGKVYGIDFSDVGCASIETTFERWKAKGKIIRGDVFNDEFLSTYNGFFDVVYSLGFIEHFTDPLSAIAVHIKLLRSGGVMIIKIPNFGKGTFTRWAYKLIGLEKHILETHNFAVMNLDTLKGYLGNFKEIEVLELGYHGPIDLRALVPTTGLLSRLKFQYLMEPFVLATGSVSLSMKSRLLSPSILAIARKIK
jgi:2-polyprenyl-3-methyl-5-hydroxy-6-metoxy-1,4-benzoquinol methylase